MKIQHCDCGFSIKIIRYTHKGVREMKFIFKVFILPILVILAIPVTILALMYKSVDIPIEEYSTTGPTNMTEMVTEELDTFLTNTDNDSEVNINLEQDEANTMIKNMVFMEMNPDYLDGSGGVNDEYVEKTEYYGLQGAWVRFEDDVVEIEAGAHLFAAGITYKTRLLLSFKLEVSTEEVVLTLDKLTVGNLGLAWAFPVADWLVKNIAQQDISSLINDNLGGLGEFDVSSRSITMDIQSLVNEQIESEQESALVNSLLAFLEANEMLDVGFSEGEFGASLALGKAYDDTEPFVLTPGQLITNSTDLQTILESKASSLLVSLLTTNTNPYISFDELTLNRMLEYMMHDSFAEPNYDYLFSTVLFEHYEMKAYIPYLTMVDEQLSVNIPLSLVDLDELTHEFKTIIKIDATPSINGADLVISLNELTAGEITIGQEHIANILTLLGDTDLIEDGNIVIKDFDQQLQQAGMSLEDVAVMDSRLRLYVGLDDDNPLGDIQNTVTDVLDDFDTTGYGDLGDDLDDLLADLDDPNTTPEDLEEAVTDVLESIEDLTDEEQEQFFEDLAQDLEDAGMSLEDILGIVPE